MEIQLSPLGHIVRECWTGIPEHFPRVHLRGFVLMPNHLHGIIEIGCKMGAAVLRPYGDRKRALFRGPWGRWFGRSKLRLRNAPTEN